MPDPGLVRHLSCFRVVPLHRLKKVEADGVGITKACMGTRGETSDEQQYLLFGLMTTNFK